MVTDEMIEAFGQRFWPVNAASKIDANREDIRAALGSALSAQEHDSADLDARMKAAGMYTIAEMMGVTPLTKWKSNPAINTIEAFSEWLDRKVSEYLSMKAGYALGDKSEDDELYEWVFAHAGVFSSIRDQFRVVTANQTPTMAAPEGWQLVPKEPTHEMLRAMFEAMFEAFFDGTSAPMMGAGYDAALTAAPAVQPVQSAPTITHFADRLIGLHGFMLSEMYQGKHAVTITFPDLAEAQQFHGALVELSTYKTPAAKQEG